MRRNTHVTDTPSRTTGSLDRDASLAVVFGLTAALPAVLLALSHPIALAGLVSGIAARLAIG